MTGFSSVWLKLREAADHRSRNADLLDAVSARFALREQVSVTDVGCGTGSNLRALAALLPPEQCWTLVDHDAGLLKAAQEELSAWADEACDAGGSLRLKKGRSSISVAFRQADLATELDAALGPAGDLVTAAAFFDLASEAFIKRFVRAVASRRAVFYTVLTYNGISHWRPHHHADNAVTAAFHRHQMTDKGLGIAAGPTAPLYLADQFRLAGYSVQEGDSPWELGSDDAVLVGELQAGQAAAVAEMGAVEPETLKRWAALARTGAVVGHTDTLAFPT